MKHGAAKQAQRIAWLQAHPDLLACLPGTEDDVLPHHAKALDIAVHELRQAKLYAASTAPDVIRWGIRVLVRLIRKGQV